ncbi:MAG: glycogen/starch synthase [Flavobacteriaceae bacterium]|nr:glycogen/starch synthase [Flavobacteriaceae bacterium]
MKNSKILVISSEVVPYLPENDISKSSFEYAKAVHSKGGQTRIFMPRFGNINERRHQLHEVIRLSGINLVVNDMDMPLIIKVASIPKERMQVYFIDNDEYFKRKALYTDENDTLFEDNDERLIFFAKGVVETVKKLNWSPDIIHIHGWMASLLPLYINEYFTDNPLFAKSKIVTSVYENGFEGELSKELADKIKFDAIDEEKIKSLEKSTCDNLVHNAITYSDAIIAGSEEISKDLLKKIKKSGKPFMKYVSLDDEAYKTTLLDFYQNEVLSE